MKMDENTGHDNLSRKLVWWAVWIRVAGAAFSFEAFFREWFAEALLRDYRQLRIGLSKDEVTDVFGKEPAHVCRIDGIEIWYLPRNRGAFSKVEEELPSHVTEFQKIPYVYDSVQVAFDRQNRVCAFTWNGETDVVRTVNGIYPGDSIASLPVEFWQRVRSE